MALSTVSDRSSIGPGGERSVADEVDRLPCRGLVPGLLSPYPIATLLPGVLRADEFALRLTEGLDEVLAPIISTLDCLEAYVDPALAPPDFLEWLVGWVGLSIEGHWGESQRRSFVSSAAELYRHRGTAEGLRKAVSVVAGIPEHDVEVEDSGGSIWSPEGGTPFPGTRRAAVTIRVRVEDQSSVNRALLEEAVRRNKPAHVLHRIEMLGLRG